jgi:hypothetical protein
MLKYMNSGRCDWGSAPGGEICHGVFTRRQEDREREGEKEGRCGPWIDEQEKGSPTS